MPTPRKTTAKKASTAADMKTSTVSSATDWKKPQGATIEVPSGHTCLVRPAGIHAFLQQGFIPNSLRQIITDAISKGGAPEMKMKEFDADLIADIIAAADAVVVHCVMAPKVWPVPKYSKHDHINRLCDADEIGNEVPISVRESDEYQRNHGIDEPRLYVDEVDLDDKMFIFQYAVGGTKDVEKFRAEQAARVESLSSGQNVEL